MNELQEVPRTRRAPPSVATKINDEALVGTRAARALWNIIASLFSPCAVCTVTRDGVPVTFSQPNSPAWHESEQWSDVYEEDRKGRAGAQTSGMVRAPSERTLHASIQNSADESTQRLYDELHTLETKQAPHAEVLLKDANEHKARKRVPAA